MSSLLKGEQIADVYADSELTYLVLANGTLITVRGLMIVEPARRTIPDELQTSSIAEAGL